MTATTTGELALEVLRRNATAFAEHAPQSRGGGDAEHVHQTRVATRRLRAALRVFRDVLPPEVGALKEDLSWIASLLGPVRDLDVQVRRLQSIAIELGVSQALMPYGAWLEEQRQRTQVAFAQAFESERFMTLTEHLRQVDALTVDSPDDGPLKDQAPRRLRRPFRQLRKRADGLRPSSPLTDFHQARIRAKRLRYAVEFFETVYGKPARRLIKDATDLQDLLGEHQDGVVSTQRIHEAIQTIAATWPAETSLALGQVVQSEAQRGESLRRQFKPAYRDLRVAWRRLRRDF
jgi:triphosphatase